MQFSDVAGFTQRAIGEVEVLAAELVVLPLFWRAFSETCCCSPTTPLVASAVFPDKCRVLGIVHREGRYLVILSSFVLEVLAVLGV